jgi:hypothetical protein
MSCHECERLIEEENQAMIEFSIAEAERRAFRHILAKERA